MAKLTAKSVALPAEGYAFLRTKRPSFGGAARLYVQQTPAGPSLRMWPRRMPGRSEAFYQAQEFVRYTSKLFQLTDRELLNQYRQFALGTFLLPRDIFMSSVAGRLFSVTLPDGRILWSRRAKEVMAQSLDIISMVNGALLYRAPWGWDALLPGGDGDVLSVGPQGLPVWTPAAALGAGTNSGVFTGLEIYAPGQGVGHVVLSDRRYGISTSGTGTSFVTFSLPVRGGERQLTFRTVWENVSQSGGNQIYLEFVLRVFSRAGDMSSYSAPAQQVQVPAQGQRFTVDFSFDDVAVPSPDGCASVTIARRGEDSRDTHNGSIAVYLVFWGWS